MKAKYVLSAAILSVFFCFSAYAAAANQQLAKQDKMWLRNAHQVNLAEIKLGKMAQRKGQSHDVRLAGQVLVTDHSMLDAQLKSLAKNLGVSLPSSPSDKQQSEAQKLSKKSGAKFDHAWTQQMIAGHKKAIDKTKKEIQQGSSSKVKMTAKTTLPVLQEHLLLLEGVASGMSSAAK